MKLQALVGVIDFALPLYTTYNFGSLCEWYSFLNDFLVRFLIASIIPYTSVVIKDLWVK